MRESRKKKGEKPAFFDLLFKFNQNCRIDFVRDSENNYIDKHKKYCVDGVSSFDDEDRAEIYNNASDYEDDSDEEEESDYDDDDEYSGVDDSDDGIV